MTDRRRVDEIKHAYTAGFLWGVEVALRHHRDVPEHEIDQLLAELRESRPPTPDD